MVLLYDEFDDTWVWVEKNNNDIELSPKFDDEDHAKLWKIRIKNLLKEELKQ